MMGSSNETGPWNSQELNTLSKCPGATWNKKEVSTTEVHGMSHQGTCLWPLPSSLSGRAPVIVWTGPEGMPGWDQRWQIGPLPVGTRKIYSALSVDPLSSEHWALHPG